MSSQAWNDDETFQEADERFPSGRWAGYWLQGTHRGRMELHLSFGGGRLFGEGRDGVGDFMLSGGYDKRGGKCSIFKSYLGQHGVDYDGVASADGIRGVWRIHDPENGILSDGGPFHIWPVGSGSGDGLAVEAEIAEPVAV